MRFHEFGDKNFPHILLIHGGGNSWWNYLRQARILSDKFHVTLPTLDVMEKNIKKIIFQLKIPRNKSWII